MANSITTTYLVNGSRLFSAKIDIVGDGSGDETGAEIIDVADLTGTPSTFKIRKMQWTFDDFSATLLWDATTDVPAFVMPSGGHGIDFSNTGAHLVNDAGTGITGKLLIATSYLGSQKGTIFIEGQHS